MFVFIQILKCNPPVKFTSFCNWNDFGHISWCLSCAQKKIHRFKRRLIRYVKECPKFCNFFCMVMANQRGSLQMIKIKSKTLWCAKQLISRIINGRWDISKLFFLLFFYCSMNIFPYSNNKEFIFNSLGNDQGTKRKRKKNKKVPIGFPTCSSSFHSLPHYFLPLGKWVKNKLTYKMEYSKFFFCLYPIVNQSKWLIAKHFYLFFITYCWTSFHLYSLEKGPKYKPPKNNYETNKKMLQYITYNILILHIYVNSNTPKI
jgi:hypothetical protein